MEHLGIVLYVLTTVFVISALYKLVMLIDAKTTKRVSQKNVLHQVYVARLELELAVCTTFGVLFIFLSVIFENAVRLK